tara:strand:- start:9 stop:221 length:213 start_codon:yes stop_codon:yes gene_type:complete
MRYTKEEIARALALAVDCLDAAVANERDAHDRSDTKLDELSKAVDVLVALSIVNVDKIAPTFGDKNDPII